MTFSNAKVADRVKREFIPSWKNIRPEMPFRDGIYSGKKGDHTVAALSPGDGETNICALVVTPDGQIAHAIQGFSEPDAFLRELEFGLKAAKIAGEGNAPERLRALYAERLEDRKAKTNGDLLLESNLRTLQRRPLPSLESLLEAKQAGLRGR